MVNTDADEVIVAKCGPHRPGQLPLVPMTAVLSERLKIVSPVAPQELASFYDTSTKPASYLRASLRGTTQPGRNPA